MRYIVAFEDAEGLMGASLSPDMTFVEARGHLLVLTSELPLEAIQAWWHDLEVHTAEATLDALEESSQVFAANPKPT